ncbi:MAG: methyl-accepting chemotaxis protein [Sphingomicrobium sp.]
MIGFKPSKCITASAVRDVARDCGDLSIECTNVSTAVGEVSSRLAASLNCLVALQHIAARLKLDQADVSWSTDEARLLALHAQQKLAAGRKSIEGCIAEFAELADLVVRLGSRITRFVEAMQHVQSASVAIERIGHKTKLLAINATVEAARAGNDGHSFSIVAAEVKKLALDTRSAAEDITSIIGRLTNEAEGVTAQIKSGVERNNGSHGGLAELDAAVHHISEIVSMVDDQTESICSASHSIQANIGQVKDALAEFTLDAREQSKGLKASEAKLSGLEATSHSIFNALAHSGCETDDSPFIEMAKLGHEEVMTEIHRGLRTRRLQIDDMFDFDYRPIPNSNPQQYNVRFNDFADRYIRPILDRVSSRHPALIGCIITDVNYYRPTHLTARCQPQRDDPQWNAEYSRNRSRNYCPRTERALANDGDFYMASNRPKFDYGTPCAVKSIFLPIIANGRKWGVFELAYRVDLQRQWSDECLPADQGSGMPDGASSEIRG